MAGQLRANVQIEEFHPVHLLHYRLLPPFLPLSLLILHTAKSFSLGNDANLKSQTCPLPRQTSSLAKWPSIKLPTHPLSAPAKHHRGYVGVAFLWAGPAELLKQGLSLTSPPCLVALQVTVLNEHIQKASSFSISCSLKINPWYPI